MVACAVLATRHHLLLRHNRRNSRKLKLRCCTCLDCPPRPFLSFILAQDCFHLNFRWLRASMAPYCSAILFFKVYKEQMHFAEFTLHWSSAQIYQKSL